MTKERIYLTFDYPGSGPGSKMSITGIRREEETLYITGWCVLPDTSPTPGTVSFLYTGDVRGTTGPCSNNKYNNLNFPSAPGKIVTSTNLYGPAVLKHGNVRVVGNYFLQEQSGAIGCMYEGPLDGSGIWTTLNPSTDSLDTIAHSTMGDLVVGNYNTSPIPIQGKAFIYDVKTKIYYEIIKPEAKSITAYGIWHNGGDWYTICGGYSNLNPVSGLDTGYLVDWNNKTHTFYNWRDNYYYQNDNINSIGTHFDGITTDGCGGYNLVGVAILANPSETVAFFAHVNRHKNGEFSEATWEKIKFPGNNTTTGNSVVDKTVIGVYNPTFNPASTIHGYISIVI
jgi:hypothetical protein